MPVCGVTVFTYFQILPCPYFVLFKIVKIPEGCRFKIDAGNFKTVRQCEEVSMYDGKHVWELYRNGEDITNTIRPDEELLAGPIVNVNNDIYAVRSTKDEKICQFPRS